MKRLFVLAFLPLVLFALEPVNLIKDAGFEKDSELWLMRSEAEGQYDSTIINRHDPDSAYIGNNCGSIDTRKRPGDNLPDMYLVWGGLQQIFPFPKKLSDLDSLEFSHMTIFRLEGVKYSVRTYGLWLKCLRPSDLASISILYAWYAPGLTPGEDTPTKKTFPDTIVDEGIWHTLRRDLTEDLLVTKGLIPDIELDTFILYVTGAHAGGMWRGQKAFFDGVRLSGYADYDVGVKEILSGDSIQPSMVYIPEARIKNFGREDAPEFSVIAEIWEGETRVYYDSLPWSLDSDTEDTVSFKELILEPPLAPHYTLTVRTVADPDECDEDDELSKLLIYEAITETPHLDAITLDVRSLTHPLRVFYSLPYAESGTLTLYDATGRRIERLNVTCSGSVELGAELPSGVYIVRLEVGYSTVTRKAVVLR